MEQCNGRVEQSWWNIVVEQWNIDGGTVWWNSRAVMVEQCCGKVEQSRWNSVVEQWNSHSGTVCWNSGTVMVEQWKSNGRTVEQ